MSHAARGSRRAFSTSTPHLQWPTTSPILVVDLEATCWKTRPNPPPGQSHEIIEIGWAILDTESDPPTITSNGTFLVKPVRSIVSEFCTELTTITPELLEAEGMTLEEAFRRLINDVHAGDYAWGSWGDYDRSMIQRQCKAFGLDSPFNATHYNIKDLFKSVYPRIRGSYGMANAFKIIMKRPLEGTHHRGGDDARNIADILSHMISNRRALQAKKDNIVQ